jgi:hypothetical protein
MTLPPMASLEVDVEGPGGQRGRHVQQIHAADDLGMNPIATLEK